MVVRSFLIFLGFVISLNISAQNYDYIIYEQKTTLLLSTPLESYISLKDQHGLERGSDYVFCSKGYLAVWYFKGEKLFLKSIYPCGSISPDGIFSETENANNQSAILNFLSAEFNDLETFAGWYTGNLVIPQGRVVQVKARNRWIYEKEIHFEVKKGIIIKTWTIENEVPPEFIGSYNTGLAKDSIFYYSSKLNWSLSELSSMNQQICLVEINRKGKVSKIRFEPISNSKEDDPPSFWNKLKLQRKFKRSINHLQFREHFKGKPRSLIVSLYLGFDPKEESLKLMN